MKRINRVKRLKIIFCYLVSIISLVKILAAFQEVPIVNDCILCRIVTGVEPCEKIWESRTHIAFLDKQQGYLGVTVVVAKQHLPNTFFEMSRNVQRGLMKAAENTSKVLKEKIIKEGRISVVIGDCGAHHLHLKLYPISSQEETFNCQDAGCNEHGCCLGADSEETEQEDIKTITAYIRGEQSSYNY